MKGYVKIVRIKERMTKMKKKKKNQRSQRPVLRFSPTAWAKLLFCRDATDNEVGGFGVSEPDDLLFVTDFVLVKQKVTCASVSFEDESVANYFEDQVEAGRQPQQFARIWLHTHPGDSPEPSCTDERTFGKVFGTCDWSVMCIVAQDSSTFARLRFNGGPGGQVKVPVCVDYSYEFDAADFELWQQQYRINVAEEEILNIKGIPSQTSNNQQQEAGILGSEDFGGTAGYSNQDLLAEIEEMDPMDREIFMEELAVKSDFWNESEVLYE
jgi:proteasome lid subunit RPN8/RPN11